MIHNRNWRLVIKVTLAVSILSFLLISFALNKYSEFVIPFLVLLVPIPTLYTIYRASLYKRSYQYFAMMRVITSVLMLFFTLDLVYLLTLTSSLR
jgi:hypothetical protein